MENYIIYAKSYPGTGRPAEFLAFLPGEGKPKSDDFVYQGEVAAKTDRQAEQFAWEKWTVKNADGFTYWK